MGGKRDGKQEQEQEYGEDWEEPDWSVDGWKALSKVQYKGDHGSVVKGR